MSLDLELKPTPIEAPMGALVVHLVLKAHERGWTRERLDTELLRGIRTLAGRVRIEPWSGRVQRGAPPLNSQLSTLNS